MSLAPLPLDGMPPAWPVRLAERIRENTRRALNLREQAAVDIAQIHEANRWRWVTGHTRDRELAEAGERYASLMASRITLHAGTRESVREAIAADVWHLAAYEFAPELELEGIIARCGDAVWWRGPLRRMRTHMRELEGIENGEVCDRRQPYCTDDTAERHRQREAANRAILEATELESEDGEIINLWQAVAASPSHKPIRRGELMTRIKGCEQWAEARGMVGLFTTNTAPSRFHPRRFKGGENPAYGGSTECGPRQAQQWLSQAFARFRSAVQRKGMACFGFRVAEPHHDGCPHWHLLMWTAPEHLAEVRRLMRHYWLQDAGDEPGAHQHRVKFKDLHAGGATAYVAKYIAKGIDDAGALEAEGHRDEWSSAQDDAFAGKAQRVAAWASAHRIRQFQAFGQPPVSVWRELRRVAEQQRQGASERLALAFEAVHRVGERRADWRMYLEAQGGAMVGRDYAIKLATREETHEGRYETTERARVIGLYEAARPEVLVLSARRQWKPRGTWRPGEREAMRAPLLAAAWRIDPDAGIGARALAQPAHLGPVSLTVRPSMRRQLRGGPLRTWQQAIRPEPGAVHHIEPPPCPPTAPPPPSPTKPPSTWQAPTRPSFRQIWSSSLA